ncbi:MAG: hypothetical protein OSB76_00265 [Alphaproteobacteria bacterium]|nr:hypothetical protein [Alphaproteobacteria bacterium]
MLSIAFTPMFSWSILAGLAAIALVFAGFGLWRKARGTSLRLLTAAVLLAAMANPVLVEQERILNKDVVAIVVDESASQKIGDRAKQTEDAVASLTEKLQRMRDVDIRIIRAGKPDKKRMAPVDGTRLFEDVQRALASVPQNRIGGTFLITDGQVHDAPAEGVKPLVPGPIHTLLTGSPTERDRRLVIENAPRFGLVGKTVEIEVLVRDHNGLRDGDTAQVTIVQHGKTDRVVTVPVGRPHKLSLELDHAGANILQLEVSPLPGEITATNNRAVVQVNGVRERLRVLLVSGEPHPGERVWRNFLKADPSVDLVHFTILRPPEKQDATPVRELSLIAFPIRELFEVKIKEFDLIIFDRYRRRGVLPGIYLENIVRYVEEGGAVLTAAGPAFATSMSLSSTPLGDILPGAPTGNVIERGLKPSITETGNRHPVTAELAGSANETTSWGRWFRQVEATKTRGQTLMNGVGNSPLLILDRVGEGRVAQLLSDHIWLWARGFENGGPHSEILRRLAHWLMKEPDLEEENLRAVVEGKNLAIIRRSLSDEHPEVEVTMPSGATKTIALKETTGGRARGTMPADEVGIYRLNDGTRTAVAAVGNVNPKEFSDMRSTPALLTAVTTASGGGMHWLEDGAPTLRRIRADRKPSGADWMGVVANRDFQVVSVRETPMLPALLVLLLGLGALMWAWRREGR